MATYDGYKKIRVVVEDGVASVALSNPPLNLVDRELFRDLRKVIDQLASDPDVRAVILRSDVPGWFSAHYDVTLIQMAPPVTEKRTEPWLMQKMTERLRTMPKATIAVIEGRAGGGGLEIALSCDMRFASHTAVLNQPEVALGLLPAGSGSQRLPRLAGRSRALEMVLGCNDVDADTAERWGLVNRVLNESDLWPFVNDLARRIASFPPQAVAATKAAVLQHEGNLDADLTAEANASDVLLADPVTQDCLRRFLELGGQTVVGESRLGELAGRIPEPK